MNVKASADADIYIQFFLSIKQISYHFYTCKKSPSVYTYPNWTML